MNPKNQPVMVAAAQAAPYFLDRNKTVQKACDLIFEAARNNAKLIVFPEAFISGYPDWVWLVPNSDGGTLDASSGQFSWTPGFDQAGNYTLAATLSV